MLDILSSQEVSRETLREIFPKISDTDANRFFFVQKDKPDEDGIYLYVTHVGDPDKVDQYWFPIALGSYTRYTAYEVSCVEDHVLSQAIKPPKDKDGYVICWLLAQLTIACVQLKESGHQDPTTIPETTSWLTPLAMLLGHKLKSNPDYIYSRANGVTYVYAVKAYYNPAVGVRVLYEHMFVRISLPESETDVN